MPFPPRVFWYMPNRLITKPGVQKPHCEPWQRTIASWAGCSSPDGDAMSSAVYTAMPSTECARRMQLLMAL